MNKIKDLTFSKLETFIFIEVEYIFNDYDFEIIGKYIFMASKIKSSFLGYNKAVFAKNV